MNEQLIEENEVVSEKEQRRQELEDTFCYDGYQIVRKELFAHLREPAVTIRRDGITFNTACINGLEDVVYVHVLFNPENKRLVVEGCEPTAKDAVRWCVEKPDKRKSRKMSCRPFSDLLYKEMDWEEDCRYKILGHRIEFEGKTLYIFDLLVPEIFHESKKKRRKAGDEVQTEEELPVVDSRKGFYPDNISGSFGLPVEEFKKATEVIEVNGFVSMGVLTGNIPRENLPQLE